MQISQQQYLPIAADRVVMLHLIVSMRRYISHLFCQQIICSGYKLLLVIMKYSLLEHLAIFLLNLTHLLQMFGYAITIWIPCILNTEYCTNIRLFVWALTDSDTYIPCIPLGATWLSFKPHSFRNPIATSTLSSVGFSSNSVSISSAISSCTYSIYQLNHELPALDGV